MPSQFNEFLRAVKFTIDYYGKQLASSMGIPDFVDLDDTVNVSGVLTSTKPCLVWRFTTMDEDPLDPLWYLTFVIGAKTTRDPSNYDMLGLMSGITEIFPVGESFFIRDWSGDTTPTQKLGSMLITASGTDQQLQDVQSGVRLLAVEARLVRFR